MPETDERITAYDALKIYPGSTNSSKNILTSEKWNKLVTKVQERDWNILEALTITPDKKVGIGNTTPEASLHIIGVSSDAHHDRAKTLILGKTASQSNLRLGYNEDYSWIQSHGSKPLVINPLGLTGSNSVGIGTYKPEHPLHVKGNTFVEGSITVTGKISKGSDQTLAIHPNKDATNSRSFIELWGDHSSRAGELVLGGTIIRMYTGSTNSTVGSEKLRVLADGNVGIGTSSPNAQLVVGSNFGASVSGAGGGHAIFGTNLAVFNTGTGRNKIYTPFKHDNRYGYAGIHASWGTLRFYAYKVNTRENNIITPATRLIINEKGDVGIGEDEPKEKFHVNGNARIERKLLIGSRWINNNTRASVVITNSERNNNFRKYNYLGLSQNNRSGWFDNDNNNPNVSLHATQRIVSPEFMAKSDIRMKEVLGLSNSQQDLKILNQIEVVDYSFKDKVTLGRGQQKKVIGQQIAKIFPQAVSKETSEFVPDVMRFIQLEKGQFNIPDGVDLRAEEVIKLLLEDKEMTAKIVAIDQNSVTIDESISGKAILYGRLVHDFHTVDYEAIAMLNVSATQELYRRLVAIEKTLEKQRSLNTTN